MAATKPLELCLSIHSKLPPSGHVKPIHNDKEFKYRGTLFRPASANLQDTSKSKVSEQRKPVPKEANLPSDTSGSGDSKGKSSQEHFISSKPRRIQSAKARLERAKSPREKHKSYDKKTSVVNINANVDIPDKEETNLMLRANMLEKASNGLNQKERLRPSSAKSTFGCPVSSVEPLETDHKPSDHALKPAVYGLKLGRQVFGNEPVILEAWANTEKDYPFRLNEGEEGKALVEKEHQHDGARKLPHTLQPLQRWIRRNTHSDVIGVDPQKCTVFLSRDYTADDLPEVPPPQGQDQDLPYTCVVATPRKEPQKKYSHPYFEHERDNLEWKCKHTQEFDPQKHGDISYILHPPYRRDPHEVRIEIAELENLMQGIGSLSSDCSFVKFQAEIRCARALARKLTLPNTSDEIQEPTDSFGLLQFYKEHDKAMEVIRARRQMCLKELSLLEGRFDQFPEDVP